MSHYFKWHFVAAILLCGVAVYAANESPFIEDLTWPEVRDALSNGKMVAIYYAGSTEQNGPHMALGKHNFIAHYVAGRIAEQLGNALVYPTMPFAPTGDAEKKTGHMRFPGSVTISDDLFGETARAVSLSAISAGFKTVFLLGDHGGGQDALSKVAEDLDDQFSKQGIHVYFIDGLNYEEELRLYLKAHKLPREDHGGIDMTSELLAIEKDNAWIRKEKLAPANPDLGVDADPRLASADLGKVFLEMKTNNDVSQMRSRLSGVLPIAPLLRKTLQKDGVQAAVKQYEGLKNQGAKYDFGQRQLEELGYELYDNKKFVDSIEIFKLEVKHFPDLWSAYDNLAEAYLANGNNDQAQANYQKSLDRNPDNQNALDKMQQIKVKK